MNTGVFEAGQPKGFPFKGALVRGAQSEGLVLWV